MQNIIAIIPARGGSKGVPKKNIKKLRGKPLIHYTIEKALEARFKRVIVSTDDEEIAKISKSIGAEIPFIRPHDLANDKASSFGLIEHAVEFFEKKNEYFDAICLLQPTYPFRTNKLINSCIKKFEDSSYDSVISVLEVPDTYNPNWILKSSENDMISFIEADSKKDPIIRRQDLPKYYFRDGAIYLSRMETIKNYKSIYGESIGYVISDKSKYVNIDTIDDWKVAESMYKSIFG